MTWLVVQLLLIALPAAIINCVIWGMQEQLDMRRTVLVYLISTAVALWVTFAYTYLAAGTRSPDSTTRLGSWCMAASFAFGIALSAIIAISQGDWPSLSYDLLVDLVCSVILVHLGMRWNSENRQWLLPSDWWPGAIVRVAVSEYVHRGGTKSSRRLDEKKKLRDEAELRAMGKVRRSIVRAATSLKLPAIERRLRYNLEHVD
ncbi:hypothetical protein [Arthrobacter tecti]